jgi:hypothetical protein
MRRRALAGLFVIVLCAYNVRAQDVNPTINFDPASDVTTVRVALDVASNLELRFNRRFNGTAPIEVPGWIGFAFGNNTELGSHDLQLVIDSAPLKFRFPDYSSFQLPRDLLSQMAEADSIEGSWDGVKFSIEPAERAGIRRFLEAISPANMAELDQPRIEEWPVDKTLDYANSILAANPTLPCNRTSLAVDAGVMHVYTRRCDDGFDGVDMFASVARLQQRGLLFLNGSISLDCAAKALCGEIRRRASANEPWTSTNNTWAWLKVEMGQGNAQDAEKVRNALEYLVMRLKEQ